MLRVILSFILLGSLIACSSAEKKSDTPEGLFAIAQELEQNDRLEVAILRYTDVKNKFPYSSYATKAELAIADVHYKAESWPEAQVSYQAFRELHPTHAMIPYVTLRVGLSFYNQLPETVDRDLTLAKDAIAAFDEVIKKFPTSEYYAEARDKKEDCLKRLAGKEDYIADFYFKRGFFAAALPRYEGLLKDYPDLGFDPNALLQAMRSAKNSGQKERAAKHFRTLKEKFGNSSEYELARKEMNR